MTKKRLFHTSGSGQYDKNKDFGARLLNRINKEPGPCWIWTGPRDVDKGNCLGYGRFCHQRRIYMAHRASYMFHIGEIPEGMFVCHKCDNPPCVNPEHLFLGTATDNNADRHRKGRSARTMGRNGSAHPGAKLTEETVLAIRKAFTSGLTNSEVMKRFSISRCVASDIKLRKSWVHI